MHTLPRGIVRRVVEGKQDVGQLLGLQYRSSADRHGGYKALDVFYVSAGEPKLNVELGTRLRNGLVTACSASA